MFRPIWPSSGVKFCCYWGNCCFGCCCCYIFPPDARACCGYCVFFLQLTSLRALSWMQHFLKARAVEADKQPLLGNGPYPCSRGMRHVRCDVMQQEKNCCKRSSLWVLVALVATQRCGKHISTAVNQHATTEEAVFSVNRPRGYITKISRSYNYSWLSFETPACQDMSFVAQILNWESLRRWQ
jgi:hypothetical protein